MTVEASEIIRFWFEDGDLKNWFGKDDGFDALVTRRFGGTYELAAAGDLDVWSQTAEGAVALVIVLDQFPRNIFRDDPKAFATDSKARAVTDQAVLGGLDQGLALIQRQFLYMPLMHSESLEDQDRCVALFAGLGDDFAETHKFAIAHRDIVARFGRFPHRNAVLGRPSSDEELAFLQQPGSSF